MSDLVKVKAAALHIGDPTGNIATDTAILHLTTADGVSIEFELDAVAVALLGITYGPVARMLKERSDAQRGNL